MSYLLDTHTFLWFISADLALPAAIRARIEASDAVRYLSVGSLWEMTIKVNSATYAPFLAVMSCLTPMESNGIRSWLPPLATLMRRAPNSEEDEESPSKSQSNHNETV